MKDKVAASPIPFEVGNGGERKIKRGFEVTDGRAECVSSQVFTLICLPFSSNSRVYL